MKVGHVKDAAISSDPTMWIHVEFANSNCKVDICSLSEVQVAYPSLKEQEEDSDYVDDDYSNAYLEPYEALVIEGADNSCSLDDTTTLQQEGVESKSYPTDDGKLYFTRQGHESFRLGGREYRAVQQYNSGDWSDGTVLNDEYVCVCVCVCVFVIRITVLQII